MNNAPLELALSAESVASGNLFTHATPESTVIVTEPDTTLEVTVSFNDDDHARWQGLVDQGMPANYAYALISDARNARHDENYRLTVMAGKPTQPTMATFKATYGKGKAWKPNHRVQAADCPEAYVRIIQGRL